MLLAPAYGSLWPPPGPTREHCPCEAFGVRWIWQELTRAGSRPTQSASDAILDTMPSQPRRRRPSEPPPPRYGYRRQSGQPFSSNEELQRHIDAVRLYNISSKGNCSSSKSTLPVFQYSGEEHCFNEASKWMMRHHRLFYASSVRLYGGYQADSNYATGYY